MSKDNCHQFKIFRRLPSLIVCWVFTISSEKSALISSLVLRSSRCARKRHSPVHGPEKLIPSPHTTPLFFHYRPASTPSLCLLSSVDSNNSGLNSKEETTSNNNNEKDELEVSDAAAATVVPVAVPHAVPTWKRVLMFYKYNEDGSLKSNEKNNSLTFRQKLAKMGLSVLLSYGFVSNMTYGVTVSLAWYIFSTRTGLSPLAPGQWKGFLVVYSGFYVFNNFVRPMRLALSVGVTPYFDKTVSMIQRKTKLSKGVAIGIVVFLANICGTTSLMSLGIYLASLAAGVPIFPKKI